jgi:hypothetical protein
MYNFQGNITEVKQKMAVCKSENDDNDMVRLVITASWLIAFCSWWVEIIRKVLTINDSTKIIHNPYLKV